MGTILNLISLILFFAVLVTIPLLAMLWTKTRYDGYAKTLEECNFALPYSRKNRYNKSDDLIRIYEDFAPLSVSTEARQLLQEYPKIILESEEIEWESKWMPVMKEFTNAVTLNVQENQLEEFSDLCADFELNEKDLSSFHQSISDAKEQRMKMETEQPWKALLSGSSFIIGKMSELESKNNQRKGK